MNGRELARDDLECILQFIGEGVIYQLADGRISYFNLAAERVFGIGSDEATTHTSTSRPWNLINEDGTPCPGEEHPSMITLRTGQALSDQVRGVARPDEPVIWLSISTRPVTRPGQTLPEAVVISFRDITLRKNLQQSLSLNADMVRVVFESAAVPMAISDRQGKWLLTNSAFCRSLGYTNKELAGKTNLDITHPDDLALTRAVTSDLIEGRLTETRMEKRYLAKDGSARWYDMCLTALREENGFAYALMGVGVDITERKRAEDELRQSEEKFHKAFMHGPMLVTISTLEDGRILEGNQAFWRVSGHTREEALGRSSVDLGWVTPIQRDVLLERIRYQGWIRDEELTARNKDGREVHLLINAEVVTMSGQEVVVISSVDISERKIAEEALRRSGETYRTLVAGLPDIIMRFDREGRHLFVSANVGTVTDLRAEDFIIKTHRELGFPEDQCLMWEEAIRYVFDSGVPMESEFAFASEKGRFYFNWRLLPERDSEGQVISVLSICRDISQAKRAQAELRASEEKFRLAFQTSPDAIAITRASDGMYMDVNQGFLDISGYAKDELVGRTSLEVSIWTDEEDRRQLTEGLKAHGQVTNMETRFTLKDGHVVPALMSASVFTLDGEDCIYSTTKIIEEQKRAESELRASEERFRQLYENAPIAYQSLNPEGIILDVNKAWLSCLGYERDEVVGRWFGSFLAQDSVPSFEQNFLCFKEQGSFQGVELSMQRKDGETLLISTNGVLTYDDAGKMLCSHCVFHDITEHRRMEAQLRQAQKMEALGTLSGGIAHDFNNILGAVLGFAEIAREDAAEGRVDPRDLEQIIASAQRAKGLVKQILTFSRKNEPALQPLSLNQSCRRVEEILRRTLPKMIDISFEAAAELPPVLADPTQVEQVLLNLSSNAADAMPEGGRLILATSTKSIDEHFKRLHPEMPAGDYVVLTVADSGAGIPPQAREHIFEPFFTTKGVGKGTGLGLSSVYGIVKSHRGFIYCQSEPGQGTIFSVYWPTLSQEEPAPRPRAEDFDEADLAGTETILVVDDEESIRDVATRMLQGVGYQVLSAGSGEGAIEAYFSAPAPPALVLMDLGMAGMGGQKAMAEILLRNPEALVVIASGYAAHNQVRSSMEAGAAGYVAKPYRRRDLLRTVRRTLDEDPT